MKRYQFLWIPRTGCSTLWGAIEKASDSIYRIGDEYRPGDWHAKYLTLQHRQVNFNNDRLIFALVRNPWDRLASIWEKFHSMPGTEYRAGVSRFTCFDEYIKYVCTCPITPVSPYYSFAGLNYCNPAQSWLRGPHEIMIPHRIWRTEDLAREWPAICETLEISGPMVKRNVTLGLASYQSYYSPESWGMVAVKYAWEINKFYRRQA